MLPVYDYEPRLQLELVEGIGQMFTACRAGSGSDEMETAAGLRIRGKLGRGPLVIDGDCIGSHTSPAVGHPVSQGIVSFDHGFKINDLDGGGAQRSD